MEQSLFIQWVNKFFPGITLRVVENLNDTKNPLTYLHKRMLKTDFSVTGKWESVTAAYSLVAADVVAMDSSLPLKKRDAIARASGDIPKMGMELKLNERQLTDLDTLVAQGAPDVQIVTKLFVDVPRCIGGIYERNEGIFLEGLSTGLALVEDTENVGTGVRLDYGYLAANKFGVAVLWSTAATATPLDDIQAMMNKASADGNSITRIMMDRVTFNLFANTKQVKEAFAFSLGFVGTTIPSPLFNQVTPFMQSRFGVSIELVDRSVRYEIDGVQTSVKPWSVGKVVGLTSDQIGSLAWARLAEMNHPVTNVTYTTADQYILVSKYRQNRPSLSEFTSSQARVVPVITNVDQIYLLDSLTVVG